MINFYDTSSLLLIADKLLSESINNVIVFSSITLQELENIKTSTNKDSHIKYTARQLLHWLDENPNKYICHIYRTYMENFVKHQELELTNDIRILATAIDYYSENYQTNDFTFFTNDLALKEIAKVSFKSFEKAGMGTIPEAIVESVPEVNEDEYRGYLEIQLDDDEIANFYSNPKEYGQKLKILTNQYLNIYNDDSDRIDTLCWTGEGFRALNYAPFNSQHLGKIKPYKNDIYQAMVADSFINNKITTVKGPAGAGKSHLSLGYLFSLLDKGKIDKIIIFCNTVATKNSAKLGSI